MIYKIYITENGAPKTGLSPTWVSLYSIDGANKLPNAPSISEVGGGWYKFEVRYGTEPFTAAELVGVIDAGSSLTSYERYIPVNISLRDLSAYKLINKASYDLVNGIETIRNDADSADEVRFQLTQSGDTEYRQIV